MLYNGFDNTGDETSSSLTSKENENAFSLKEISF